MRKSERWIWKGIATGGGLGYSPVAPGTAGALGALVPAFFILHYTCCPGWILGGLVVLFTLLGTIASARLEPAWGKDPQTIVIDEVVGMWIALTGTGSGWITLAAGFLLFRFFDIVKPLGIRQAERLRGGFGVMADDILAGIYANVLLQIALKLIPGLA